MDKICGSCRHYTMHQVNGPWCTLKRKEVSYLQQAFDECFEEPEETPKDLGPTKVCVKCGRELPVSNFGRHSRTKDGYQPCCRECLSKQNSGHRKRKPFEHNEAPAKPEEPEAVPEGMKKCCHCGRILPVTEFRRHSKAKDGLQSACKECQVEMTTDAKQKRTENKKEVIKEAQKEALKVKLISEFPETDRGQLDEAIKAIEELKKEMEKTQTIIGNATDEQLVEELRRRGYQGNLIKKTSFIL